MLYNVENENGQTKKSKTKLAKNRHKFAKSKTKF